MMRAAIAYFVGQLLFVLVLLFICCLAGCADPAPLCPPCAHAGSLHVCDLSMHGAFYGIGMLLLGYVCGRASRRLP